MERSRRESKPTTIKVTKFQRNYYIIHLALVIQDNRSSRDGVLQVDMR